MQLPSIGELNRRAKLYKVETVPDDEVDMLNQRKLVAVLWAKLEVIGGSAYLESINTEETVTHRIYVRSIAGVSTPIDLQHLTEVELDGFIYQVRRITDVNSAGRFTLLECEQMSEASAEE